MVPQSSLLMLMNFNFYNMYQNTIDEQKVGSSNFSHLYHQKSKNGIKLAICNKTFIQLQELIGVAGPYQKKKSSDKRRTLRAYIQRKI